MTNSIVKFDGESKRILETIELGIDNNHSNTCIIDFAMDKKGNILARNYSNSFYFDLSRRKQVVEVSAYSSRSFCMTQHTSRRVEYTIRLPTNTRHTVYRPRSTKWPSSI